MISGQLVLTSALANLFFAIAALMLVILTLRVLDKMAGFNFRGWLNDEHTSDIAKAMYFSARILACAVVVGQLVSVPI